MLKRDKGIRKMAGGDGTGGSVVTLCTFLSLVFQ